MFHIGEIINLQFGDGLKKTVDWYLESEKWLNDVTIGNYQRYYQRQYENK